MEQVILQSFNYIDLGVLVILGSYIIHAIKVGPVVPLTRLSSLLISIVIAFMGYMWLGNQIVARFELPLSMGYAIGFVILLLLSQLAVGWLIFNTLKKIPNNVSKSLPGRLAAMVPGAINGAITIGLLVLLTASAPLGSFSEAVAESRTNDYVSYYSAELETRVNSAFDNALQTAFSSLTIKPEPGERVKLPFSTTDVSVNAEAEATMLELVNEERVSRGIEPLVRDPALVPVARSHSRDMFARGYFSHTNLEGQTPSDRLEEAGVEYQKAGENIALAQTVALAHRSLMNSPGHRRNILDPEFTRIGIGAMQGGFYGVMFTQNFAR